MQVSIEYKKNMYKLMIFAIYFGPVKGYTLHVKMWSILQCI